MPDAADTPSLLHIADLYKVYDGKVVLDNIDLSVRKGEFCSLVGPSGCGKSTLLRIVLGQEQQTRGVVKVDGVLAGPPDCSRGIVYQRYGLFPHLTVLENVLLGRKLSAPIFAGLKARPQWVEEATAMLREVKLENEARKY